MNATPSLSKSQTFGAIFGRRRKRLGISLQKVAVQVRSADGGTVSRSYLHDIESSRRIPSVVVILELCRVLKIDPDRMPWSDQHCVDLLLAYLADQPEQSRQVGRMLNRVRQKTFKGWEHLLDLDLETVEAPQLA